jgi:hypothetical protein
MPIGGAMPGPGLAIIGLPDPGGQGWRGPGWACHMPGPGGGVRMPGIGRGGGCIPGGTMS